MKKLLNPAILSFCSLQLHTSASGLLVSSRAVTSLHHSIAAAAADCRLSIRFSPLALFNRRSLLIATMATSSASSLSSTLSDESLQRAVTLLDSIYSPVKSSDFPRPMSPEEAGPCCTYASNSVPQRRYLWTDAFAVLAYQTISDVYSSRGQIQEANLYKDAVEKLIGTVHTCLGKPRSDRNEDTMTRCDISPTGFVGLRIGKVESRMETDYGMRYDGQYFHYIDKWLFALSRTNHIEDGLRIAKSIFPYFFSKTDRSSGGIRWKLSIDASPPNALTHTYGPNDDTLNALIVYTMLESQRQRNDACMPHLSLQDEIDLLQESLRHYHPRVMDDPLGWGLEAIFDQFVEGHPRTHQLRLLAPDALSPSHISLPFRLYGALIGATVSNERLISDQELQKVKEFCVKYQFREMEKSECSGGKHKEDFAEINRVMLAVALLGSKSALSYKNDDITVQLKR